MAQSCPSALLGVPGKKLHCAFFILSCNQVLLKEIYYFYVTDGWSFGRSVVLCRFNFSKNTTFLFYFAKRCCVNSL